MTKIFISFTLLLVCAVTSVLAAAQSSEESARSFVLSLHNGEFSKAAKLFDKNMKKALSPEQLQAIWNAQLRHAGTFDKIERTTTKNTGPYRVIFVTCQFKKKRLDVKVVIDKTDRVAGLFFVPVQSAKYKAPAYVDKASFKEVDVQVGKGEWKLPGTLTLPNGKGPFPAVVLVHGSGPQDRDETIGPNKPFRDLAWGLASRGIAVLRYEKRTKHYAAKCAGIRNLTVQNETIDDAVQGLILLQNNQAIQKNRIFVLGHSLGGMLIPRIGTNKAKIAGMIVMAGNARPLEDLILEQTLYQASLAGELSANAKAHIEAVKKQVTIIKKLNSKSSFPGPVLGAPKSYWLDLRNYNPAEAALAIRHPMLIMQGKKDCQVSYKKDFQTWRRILARKQNVKFMHYPNLNHLFMKVDGSSTGTEYQQPGNVDAQAVKDIASWIMGKQ